MTHFNRQRSIYVTEQEFADAQRLAERLADTHPKMMVRGEPSISALFRHLVEQELARQTAQE